MKDYLNEFEKQHPEKVHILLLIVYWVAGFIAGRAFTRLVFDNF